MTPLVGIPQPMDAQGREVSNNGSAFNVSDPRDLLTIGELLFHADDVEDMVTAAGKIPANHVDLLLSMGRNLVESAEQLRRRRVRVGVRKQIVAAGRVMIRVAVAGSR